VKLFRCSFSTTFRFSRGRTFRGARLRRSTRYAQSSISRDPGTSVDTTLPHALDAPSVQIRRRREHRRVGAHTRGPHRFFNRARTQPNAPRATGARRKGFAKHHIASPSLQALLGELSSSSLTRDFFPPARSSEQAVAG
jgi:hypothetical protein